MTGINLILPPIMTDMKNSGKFVHVCDMQRLTLVPAIPVASSRMFVSSMKCLP